MSVAIPTYAALKTAIASWLNRADLTAEIPIFIDLAETMFDREIKWHGQIVRDVVDDGVDEVYEDLPSDYIELVSIRSNTNPTVVPEYRTPSVLERWRAENPGAGGTPEQYTIVGRQFVFDRQATGLPVLDFEHYAKHPRLSDSQTTNALLDEASDIYLFGALMSAEPFLKNDPRLATWTALYQNARDGLMAVSKQGRTAPSPLVTQPRRPAFS